jgi:serine/threonine-protein kinase
MATVYVGTDTRLDRMVAIKIAHPELAADADFVRRFIGEARSAARLSSPNVVATFDQGTDGPLHYIAMEYVPGRTLRELLNERGRLGARESLDIMTGVLSGLAAAHQAGLAHRDVKPENVLLTAGGDVKVADFGLARSVAGAIQTKGGMLIGTAAYLAPEQVIGGTSDARTDVYAAGVMLYEMLTGTQPHTGESPLAVAYKHVNDIVPAPSSVLPGLSPALDALVALATSRDPELRPADAGQLLRAIADVRAGHPVPGTTPYPGPGRTASPSGPYPDYPASAPHRLPDREPYPYRPGDDPGYGGYALPAWESNPGAVGASALPSLAPAQAAIVPVMPAPHADQRSAVNHTLIVPGGLHDDYAGPADGHRAARGRGGQRGRSRRIGSPVAPLLYGRRPVYLCAGLALALVIALSVWWLNTGQYAQVPALKGVDVTTAKAELHNLGLRWKLGKPQNSTLPKGEVLSVSPAIGAKVTPGAVITLVVSLGPVVIQCPNVSGQPLSQAQAALRQAHLTPGTVKQATSSTVPAGNVISTTPRAYAQCPLTMPVGLTVSAGPGLPNFVGQQLSAAQAAAQQGGYTINPVPDAHSTQPANTITSQSPAANTPITQGEVVTVYVSQGPPQVPVPDVQGLPLRQAIKELRQAGFQWSINQGLGNTVVSYSPTGTAPQGSVITLNVGFLSGV